MMNFKVSLFRFPLRPSIGCFLGIMMPNNFPHPTPHLHRADSLDYLSMAAYLFFVLLLYRQFQRIEGNMVSSRIEALGD